MNKSVSPKNPVALIAGPTASGKSALAIRLAEITDGVVINADASQVYADLRVLSARPDPAEEARAPHRLFGYRDAAEPCSAADWAADAKGAIAAAREEGKLPILVGGTGLYLRTLIFGIAPVPEIDPAVRAEVRALPVEAAHAALAAEDPAMGHLRPQDATRIARALEVIRSTGRSLSQWQAELSGGIGGQIAVAAAILLPPRDWLRARCDARFEAMLGQGAVEEVTKLRARGLDPMLPAMQAIGVREIGAWQDGLIDRATMVAKAQAATRQYAKRQYTWFRHQPPAAWQRIDAQLNDNEIDKIAIKLRDDALTE
ncbi:tRNA (adenosine(37)-N6)-dimethylallyltransferase MiaA [Sphingomonas histidinilytica]|uniref:tRNA (adenosine(37)-N6)-dimethylallyltransferase MiaA n=1 Tax=Rhizorhabdus histidinilytica TaxID=439228 RepID=UPI0009A75B8D|nr:tRNA (adenosine(37)-N6)-dimethylallyltransferase MiaA [Rhizorhabdus histidinilytica]MBO9379550.1 tRNA (adenosine(37)-N6)-dimethylallyltransferase MiaA [Rhizorhabdus histidinilytica]